MKKLNIYYFLLIVSFFNISTAFGQGLTCDAIEPFCAGDTTLIFPNNTIGFAEAGPDYGCLGSQPAPSWYFIQIDEPGDLNFNIEQNEQADLSGAGLDVDFIAWGPFTNTNACNDLTAANTIACSFSPDFIENFTITGALAGEIYILLITNFIGSPGFIQLQQTNAGGGSTDCSIINTTNHCEGDIISLDATTTNAVLFEWFRDGILLPETGPILTNVVAPSAVYTANALDSLNNIILDFEFIVEFHAMPTATAADNLLQCDDDNDGFWAFDLSLNDALILEMQPNLILPITSLKQMLIQTVISCLFHIQIQQIPKPYLLE